MTNLHQDQVVDTIVTPDQKISEATRPTRKSIFKWFKPDSHTEESLTTVPKVKKDRKKLYRVLGIVGVVFLILTLTLGFIGFRTFSVAMSLKTQAYEAKALGTTVKDKLKAQDLPSTEASLIDLQTRVENMKSDYAKLSFYKGIPIARNYYLDGEHALLAAEAGVRAGLKTIDAIVPYADVLGFTGEGTFTGGTTEDRLKVVLETLSKITPVLDDITTELKVVDAELAQINAQRYPEHLRGTAIRSQIVQAQTLTKGAVSAMTDFRPALEVLPEIAGSGKRKKYLVIFQNDNELRPTGGFMTAYAVMFIENGKVTPEKSDDIYELDKKFTKRIPIPEVLGRYLTSEQYFNLRDMNISPDFKASMETFYSHYQEVRGEPGDIDGIISVDTNLLTELVRVLGPVEVPGYGTFSADNDPRCDCPQIIYVLSEIVDRPTPYLREDRKGIIAPMMQAILQKAYSAPNSIWPQLVELGWGKIEGRHVQFYFFDEKYQQVAETVNVAGGMNTPKNGEDYLAVVDANLGGAKSNLFVTTEGRLQVGAPENGTLSHTLDLTYKNNRKGDNCNLEAGLLCLNGTLRDWVRIYLPAGSKLVKANGFDEGTLRESEDLGFYVIEGVMRLAPLSQAKLQIEYTTPYDNATDYHLIMRKQAGTDSWKYVVDINGEEREVLLNKDLKVDGKF